MAEHTEWLDGVEAAVTVTAADGTILAMNRRARQVFSADGGGALIGSSVFDCHPEPSRSQTEAMFATRTANHYTVGGAGERTVVHQIPWFEGDTFRGFVEIAVPVGDDVPHRHRRRDPGAGE